MKIVLDEMRKLPGASTRAWFAPVLLDLVAEGGESKGGEEPKEGVLCLAWLHFHQSVLQLC